MANPTASDDGRRRRRARRRARSGHTEAFGKLGDDIELVQQPTVEELPGSRTDFDTSGSVPQRRVAHSTTMQTAPVSRSASSTSAPKTRNRRHLSHRSDSEERQRRRRRPSRNDGHEPPLYVYGAPLHEKRPRTRISKARAVGNGDGSHTSSENEGSMPVISEEKDERPRNVNQRETKAEKPGSSTHRRRRRRTEEERVARRQAREVKESATSVSHNKTSSPRKESSQPLDFIRRTLSTSNVAADPRPVLKRSHSTSGSHLPRKSSASGPSVTALNAGRRSSFMGMFTPTIKEEAPVKLVKCVTCLSDDIPRNKSAKLKCGHRMCHSCLKRIFRLSVTDPQHMPPKCCTTDHIPLKHVDKLFDTPFKKNWNRKFQEFTTKNRIYCPSRRCGEWIKPGNMHTENGKKYGKCGRCKTKVCTLCNGKLHGKKDCPKDEETNRLLATAKEAGWQRCYSCRTMVELKEGCNHMTCRCTAEFCMICGLKWKSCSCPWFTYEPAAADDRLNHMRVPVDAAPFPANNPFHPLPADPLVRPPRRRDFAHGIGRPRRDDELIRLMHGLHLDLGPAADDPDDGYNGPIGAVHGLGNAAGHFMNETYRRPLPHALAGPPARHLLIQHGGPYYPPAPARDLAAEAYNAAPTTRPEERVVPRRRGLDYAGEAARYAPVGAARARRARVEVQAEESVEAVGPRPSELAGLGGSRKGSGRVGEWRAHVELGVTPEEGVISYVS